MAKEAYFQLQIKFEKDHREGIDVIKYEDMTKHIRDRLCIFENIQALIFGQYVQTGESATVDGCLKVINQYVLTKKILLA